MKIPTQIEQNLYIDMAPWGPFYKHGLTLISAWMGNYIHYIMWDEIIHPSPNFNGETIKDWEGISNFILHFTGNVITYPCWDLS